MIGGRRHIAAGAAVVPAAAVRAKGKISPAVLVIAGVGVLGLGSVALLDVNALVARLMGKESAATSGGAGPESLSRPSFREWDRSLLALDLGTEGLRQRPLTDSRAFADLDRDGFAERRAWFGPEDGLLARDRNANGLLDGAGELLIGQRGGPDASTALMTIDADQNGRLTARDPEFRDILVWRDLDGDGRAIPVEVRPLTSYFVGAVEPLETPSLPADGTAAVRQAGRLLYADGRSVAIYEAGLASDPGDTAQLVPAGFQTAPGVLQMPILEGGGRIGSSTVAMSRDATLLAQGDRLIGLLLAGDLISFRREIEFYLHRWAGVPATAAPGTAESAAAFVAASWGVSTAELWSLVPGGASAKSAKTVMQTYRSMRDAYALSFARQAVDLQNGAAARELSTRHALSFLVARPPATPKAAAEPSAPAELQAIAASMMDAVFGGRLSTENGIAGLSMVLDGDPRTVGLEGSAVLLDASTVLKREAPSAMIALFEAERAGRAAAAAAMDADAAALVGSSGRSSFWDFGR